VAIAGAARGAAGALEQILAEQMVKAQMAQRERENQQRVQMDQDRLTESTRQFNVRSEADDRDRRDKHNDRGLDLMKADKADMDLDTAANALPAHLKPIAGLFKVGAVGKLSPDDFKTPEQRAQEARDAEASEIRIRQAGRTPAQAPEKKPQVVRMPDGSIQDLNGVLPPGAVPYDPVAARSSKPEDQAEAADTANEVKRIASALRNHKGLPGAFGVMDSKMPTIYPSTADAEVLLNSLTSLLTMENMGKMKGVLSDSDMKVLRQASSTLSNSMSDDAARVELDRIVEVMGRTGQGAPQQTPPDPQQAGGSLYQQYLNRKKGGQ
jgi:hypothetical protein